MDIIYYIILYKCICNCILNTIYKLISMINYITICTQLYIYIILNYIYIDTNQSIYNIQIVCTLLTILHIYKYAIRYVYTYL